MLEERVVNVLRQEGGIMEEVPAKDGPAGPADAMVGVVMKESGSFAELSMTGEAVMKESGSLGGK